MFEHPIISQDKIEYSHFQIYKEPVNPNYNIG